MPEAPDQNTSVAAPARGAPAAVAPPAMPGKMRRRHWFLLVSFFAIVALPTALTVYYLYGRAVDQYASHLGFSVRAEETASPIELLGGITGLSGSSTSDTDILYSYLTSQKLVRELDNTLDLRALWSKPELKQDPVFTFDATGSIEDLMEHWERKVTIVYDSGTGMIDLRVLAYSPQDAQHIAKALFSECSRMINNLSAIAREDAIQYAREDLREAAMRVKTARQVLTAFRNRTQIVDPSIDTINQMGLLTTLQQQLAETLIDLDLLRQSTGRSDDPRILQAQRRVEVIEARITAERRKLGLGSGAATDEGSEEGEAFANLVGEYEGLIVDREFAETAYTATLASFDAARAEARRQSRYLAAYIEPTLAETAEYPERLKFSLLTLTFLFFAWAIFVLVYYSLRDRR